MQNTRCTNQRGQSAVEGILILLLMIAILIGVLDFGQLMFLHQTLAERARGAARYAALNPTNFDGARNLVVFGNAVAPSGSTDTTKGFWGLTTSMVSVVRNNQNTNEDEVIVTISSYPFQFFSPWIAGAVRGKPIVASSPVEST